MINSWRILPRCNLVKEEENKKGKSQHHSMSPMPLLRKMTVLFLEKILASSYLKNKREREFNILFFSLCKKINLKSLCFSMDVLEFFVSKFQKFRFHVQAWVRKNSWISRGFQKYRYMSSVKRKLQIVEYCKISQKNIELRKSKGQAVTLRPKIQAHGYPEKISMKRARP